MNKKNSKPIHIIDLFAGPGGLGEGFSSCDHSRFKIDISVEKDLHAHGTLKLRSFYRKLKNKEKYYNYVSAVNEEERETAKREMITTHKAEWEAATEEVLEIPTALGNSKIFEKWKAGETPTFKDFKDKTLAQKNIVARIEKILKEAGRKPFANIKTGNPVIVIGGPPCQAYSRIGRSRRVGIVDHNPDHDERFFLYKEYAEIIALARPDLFVMENVVGIGSARLSDDSLIFPKILERLEYLEESPSRKKRKEYHLYSLVTPQSEFVYENGYPIEKNFKVCASDYGVPQNRERIIIVGVRADRSQNFFRECILNKPSAAPTIKETIESLPKIRSHISTRGNKNIDSDSHWYNLRSVNLKRIEKLISGKKGIKRAVKDAITWEIRATKLSQCSANELPQNYSTEDIDILELSSEQLYRIEAKRLDYENLFSLVFPEICAIIDSLSDDKNLENGDDSYLKTRARKKALRSNKTSFSELETWLHSDISGCLNHNSKKHMPEDLTRYLYSCLWTNAVENLNRSKHNIPASPLTKHFPLELASNHKSWFSHKFQDRFRTHPPKAQARTITAHMHKDGHANIHYDPMQNRSLTVREAARLQTFPDDYYFMGGQSKQFQQVGNAVPPFLAKLIAEHVAQIIDSF